MRTNGDLTADQTTVPTEALTVAEAAEALGITTEAARMRVKRGTLPSTRIDGTVYILLDRPNLRPHGPNPRPNDQSNPRPNGSAQRPNGHDSGHADTGNASAGALLAAKDETIQHLRRELDARNEELRRKDTIIMTLAQRVPELEAPQNGQENARRSVEREDREAPQSVSERPSWWRRFIGFG